MHIVLFFTRGMSLGEWDRIGMFDREVALYEALQQRGVRVSFVTYGGPEELEYRRRLPGIRILCNRWRLAPDKYERWLPWLHWPWTWRADLVKTNQMNGAEVAVWAARRWRKPVIARCGYMWSEFAVRQQGAESVEAREATRVETFVFSRAARIVVTTPAMRDDILQRFPTLAGRIGVIPNYVDTSCLRPGEGRRKGVLFVGRLSRQKNISALLDAMDGLPDGFTIIGDGEQADMVGAWAGAREDRVTWRRRMPHADLAGYYQAAVVYVLPSAYEGHPKTLIEAMACGCAVVCADSPGIRELIRHGETGWLCGTDAGSIREAVKVLLGSPELCVRLGENARHYAVAHFALDRIVEQELAVYGEVAIGGRAVADARRVVVD